MCAHDVKKENMSKYYNRVRVKGTTCRRYDLSWARGDQPQKQGTSRESRYGYVLSRVRLSVVQVIQLPTIL